MKSSDPTSSSLVSGTKRSREGEVELLRRRVAMLEQGLAEWVDRYESSPIPMTVEDWSECKRIVDRLRAAGVESIIDHVRENPQLLAELAPAVKIRI